MGCYCSPALKKRGAILDLPCPSVIVILSFRKLFVTLFSGTVRPRRLKLGTHVDCGQMYSVYQNQAAAAYLSLYFVIFLSLQLSNIKIFRLSSYFFQELRGLED